jgi:hypothetical protein
MIRIPPAAIVSAAIALATLSAVPAKAAPGYADIADLTLAAPALVRATITRAERISDKDSPGLRPGSARLLVTAAVNASLVAPGAIPASLQWLWDAPLDARGKPPKPKGEVVLAWLTAPAADGKTALVARNAQLPWDAATEARARAIATEARSGSVAVVTGVSNGFRADGTVAGESESQFFLTTTSGKNLTMVVTAKPGEARSVAIARGDVIDESAARVLPGTLLQYRLACFLPAALPTAAGGGDPALAADWKAALVAIGACGRSPNR